MKRGPTTGGKSAGFTIVETMIVLVVTGFIFVAVAMTWLGRQHKSEFMTAARDLQTQLQQVVADVQNGYYPSADNILCSLTGGATNHLHITQVGAGSDKEQGTLEDCVFLGKAVQFGLRDDAEGYRIYPVAGMRDADDNEGARSTVLATSIVNPDAPDMSDRGKLLYGLHLVAAKSGSAGLSIGTVAFLGRMSAEGAAGNEQGGQQIDLYALQRADGPYLDTTNEREADEVDKRFAEQPPAWLLNQETKLCFKSGGTDQYALITIGGAAQNLVVNMRVVNDNETNCGL